MRLPLDRNRENIEMRRVDRPGEARVPKASQLVNPNYTEDRRGFDRAQMSAVK